MDNNTTPAAPVPASDATPNTNSNPAPAAQVEPQPQAPEITLEQAAQFIGMKPELLKERMDFEKVNGGPEKAYANFKKYISDPSTRPSNHPEQLNDSITQTQPVMAQQAEMQKPAEGYLSANDIAKLQYNKMLSEAYSELDKEGYITKGEFVKEATSMGIPVMDQAGNMNDAAIRKFLDLKKATIPPAPASAPITTTPTVDYVHTEGDITSQETADAIMKQGTSHPRYNEAMKFTRERIFGKKPEQKNTDTKNK